MRDGRTVQLRLVRPPDRTAVEDYRPAHPDDVKESSFLWEVPVDIAR